MTTTTRTDTSAVLSQQTVTQMLNDLPAYSSAARSFRVVPMAAGTARMPVLDTLPVAFFVNGEANNSTSGGWKRASRMAWANKQLVAEEIAVILPVPIAVIDDADFDLVAFARDKGTEALAITLDAAVLFGVDKPATWGASVAAHATAAGHTVVLGTATAAEGGVAEDFNRLFSLVEDDGFAVTGVMGATRLRGNLRGARDAEGRSIPEVSPTEVYGVAVSYPAAGQWDPDVRALVADTTQGILGVRTDVTADILSEATIQDPVTGDILFNLAQQNMRAVRLSFRVAWQVANTVRREQTGTPDANVSPFGVLTVS